MSSRFDDLFAAAGIPPLMEQFGISASYRPVEGLGRTITVGCSEDEPGDQQDETTERRYERLWVFCRRSATLGIDDPQHGDAFLRDKVDDDTTPWGFQGEVRNVTAGSWELLFARLRPRRYGPRAG